MEYIHEQFNKDISYIHKHIISIITVKKWSAVFFVSSTLDHLSKEKAHTHREYEKNMKLCVWRNVVTLTANEILLNHLWMVSQTLNTKYELKSNA